MVRHSCAVLAVLLLAACRQFENPTAPESGRAMQTEATSVHGITVLPDTTVVVAGKKTTASASMTIPRLDVTFSSDNPAVAKVTGKIPRGSLSTELEITGVAPGHARITYTIMNFAGAPGSGSAGNVEVVVGTSDTSPPCVVPTVTASAANTTVRSGESTELSARAEGTGPFTYQWFENGNAISGATARVYTTRPLTAPTTYTVKATSSCGSRTSEPLTISVATPGRRRAAGR